MPYIQVTLLKGRTAEQKRRMAERITNVMIEEGKASREAVMVSFIDVETDSFARAGVLAVDAQAQKLQKT